jgi:pimeloyl-ACP methyl ester carboxylesterase
MREPHVVVGMPRIALAAALGTLVLAGCGSAPAHSVVVDRPAPQLSRFCKETVPGQRLWFRAADGVVLAGTIVGKGPRTVVVAHGYPGSLCDLLPAARSLADAGFRVVLFDFRGAGLSAKPKQLRVQNHVSLDIAAAARLAREHGARKLFLVGFSFGGTAVTAAAPAVDPAPDGVVDVSGPASLDRFFPESNDLDAAARAPELRSPFLYLVAREDFRIQLAESRALVRAVPVRDKRLVVYPSYYHAFELLYDAPYAVRVWTALLDFLRTR